MNIYWCIPTSLYVTQKSEQLENNKEILVNEIRRYYKKYEKFEIEIINKNISNMEIYIMGEHRYASFQKDVENSVKSAVVKCYGENVGKGTKIALHYAQFNPNFKPISDDISEVKKNINEKNLSSESKLAKDKDSEFDYERLSYNYEAVEPRFSFDQVILPQKTFDQIEEAIGILEVETKVFDEWGLRAIIPEATSALSFYGPPGTGKTMTAEAIAHKLGKKILRATYADIESKFHGEGPKMVKAIFRAAERDKAVLFLDESDSLLSKRLTSVSDGSAQAINSMRSQLLISLENFKGVVIFATNLVVNYDKAFLSRLINVEFTNPTVPERKKIWINHLKTDKVRIPLAEDVDIDMLSQDYELCGREIKNIVKNACISVALKKRDVVTQRDFVEAAEKAVEDRKRVHSAKDQTQMDNNFDSDKKQEKLKQIMQGKIDNGTLDVVKVDNVE